MDFRWMEIPASGMEDAGKAAFEILGLLDKGWSTDRKFLVRMRDGTRGLLRVSDISMLERKQEEFRFVSRVHGSGVRCGKPYAFGTCEGERSCCMLLSYLEGDEAETSVPTLPEEEQRRLGLEAGRILKRIHNLDSHKEPYDWADRMRRKVETKKRIFLESGIVFEGYGILVSHITRHLHLLEGRPLVLQHGDYHLGNMVLMEDRGGPGLGILDFNRFDYGDPYEDFTRLFMFSARISPEFARGQIEGYFGGAAPEDFFPITSLYVALDALSGIPWARDLGKDELNLAITRAETIMSMYNGFRRYVPAWGV